MRNASSIILLFVSLVYTPFSFGEDGEGKLPTFQASARVNYRAVLEEPLRGFEKIAVYELNDSITNRFNPYWYINALSNSKDLEYPADQFTAAFKGGAGDALRQYFIDDFATSLPIFMWLQDQIENVAPDNFLEHWLNFGIRPFDDDNPSIFASYTMKIVSEEILDLQCRVHLRDWSEPVPEVVIRIPLDNWSVGAGLRYESRSGFQSNDRTWNYEQGLVSGVTYFFGFQGPLLGGWFFVSTGYPVPVTILYSRPF